jgi:hypothetical protein
MPELIWMNVVSDWAQNNDIPEAFFRDEFRKWHVRFELKDSRGWYRVTMPFPGMKKASAGQATEDQTARIHRACGDAVMRARCARMQRYIRGGSLAA